MNNLFLLLLLLGMTTELSAQKKQGRNCQTMPVLERQLQESPTLRKQLKGIEQHTADIATQAHLSKHSPITIPVVVHIIHRNATENIPDSQVHSQIAILNADFNRLNADLRQIPSVFKPLAANTGIRFCLARRDPQGRPTTGIKRYASNHEADWTMNDDIKKPAQGGAAPWNPAGYLNIWVSTLYGGALGYAQFPGGNPATDGVVINVESFGKLDTNTTSTAFYLGRTATHEVGHWFNLRHLWGDANCGDDFVADTPQQAESNIGCPTFPQQTCNNGANGDMFMNFMDYTDDACMFMFTRGQKARMLALFAPGGARASFLQARGCQPPCNSGYARQGESLEVGNELNLAVYPNPADLFLRFEWTQPETEGLTTFQLTDMTGKIVTTVQQYISKMGENTLEIPTQSLPNGLYLLNVFQEVPIFTQKIVIQH